MRFEGAFDGRRTHVPYTKCSSEHALLPYYPGVKAKTLLRFHVSSAFVGDFQPPSSPQESSNAPFSSSNTPQGKIRKLEIEARESEARSEAHKNEREDLENRLAEAEVGVGFGRNGTTTTTRA